MRVMSKGAESMKRWREAKGLTQLDMSQLLGTYCTVVSMYERGHRKPGIVAAMKIEDVTGGAVTARMWVEAVS